MFGRKKIDWASEGADAGYLVKAAAIELCKYIWETEKPKKQEDQIKQIILACSLYFVVVAREAEFRLPEEDRENFKSGMLTSLIEQISNVSDNPATIADLIRSELHMDIDKLAGFSAQLVPDEGTEWSGTLYWEFTNILAHQYEIKSGDALDISIQVVNIGTLLLQSLDQDYLQVMSAHR